MGLTPDSLLRRNSDVLFTPLDNEWLGIDAVAESCHSLNESAYRVWDSLRVPKTLSELCQELRQEYDVDEPTCVAAVTALVGQLHGAGLVAMQ